MTTKLETLASLISASSGSPDVFMLEKPQNNNDCIVYKVISSQPVRSHSGTLFEKTHVELNCWGTNATNSQTLATNMKTLLDCNTHDFKISYLDNNFDVKEIETGLFRSILDFYIW